MGRLSRWLALMSGLCLAAGGAALSYALAGSSFAPAGAVVGAVAGAFAPSFYEGIRERAGARDTLRKTFEPQLAQGWARLLDPRHELVSFIGRETELEALISWCEDDDAGSLRLITGPGGVGKTRLAVEFSDRIRMRNWTSERVADGQEAHAISALRALSHTRALLVVDYAETRVQLKQMLAELARYQGERVRVLLIARSTGDWWDLLGVGDPPAWDLVQDARGFMLTLSPIVAATVSDADIISAAVDSFARALGRPQKVVELYGDSGVVQRRILDLHAAALVAVLAEEGPGSVRIDMRTVLDELLRHEQHFWYESARACGLYEGQHGVTAQQIRQIVAASCLLGATTRKEARKLARRIPGISSSARLADWLRNLYPPDPATMDWLGSLQPDRLAELHVMKELIAAPEIADRCLDNLDARQALQALTLLARAASDYPEAESLLTYVLPDVIDLISTMHAPEQVLHTIFNAIPYPTVLLGPSAIALSRRALNSLPGSVEPRIRMYWLDSLASRLAASGRHEEALSCSEEAVAICRQLAVEDPEQTRSELALVLMNLGNRLRGVGRQDEALPPASEAVSIYRDLAADPSERQRSNLGAALTNFGNILSDLDRASEAETIGEEAVKLFRELAAASNLNEDRFSLAISLNNLGERKSAMGRTAEALRAAQEATEIFRNLAALNKDRYLPSLAHSLGVLECRFAEERRLAEAFLAIEESAAVNRELAIVNPDHYRADLALALSYLSSRYAELSRPEEALAANEEAVNIYRELAITDPGRHRAELARVLDFLGMRFAEAGRPEEALDPTNEAVTIFRELAAASPSTHSDDLALALNNMSLRFAELSRPKEALAAGEEAVSIYRELATTDLERYRFSFAMTLENLGLRLAEERRPAEALAATEEAVSLYRELATANPDFHREGLPQVLDHLGGRLTELGRPAEALTATEEGVSLYRELAAANPDLYRDGFARVLDNLALRSVELGRPAKALAATEECITIYRKLAVANPGQYQPALSRALARLASLDPGD